MTSAVHILLDLSTEALASAPCELVPVVLVSEILAVVLFSKKKTSVWSLVLYPVVAVAISLWALIIMIFLFGGGDM